MTLRHLQIFTEVYNTQNITQASQNLHITQPAVTRAVQELEQHYGVPLFERIRRRLSPTQAGQKLYGQAVHLLDTFDQMETCLKNWDACGRIRIGATLTLGSTLLPELAQRFAERYPGIELRVTVANGEAITSALCQNQLDLALLETRVLTSELHSEEIGSDRLCAVLSPQHPLAALKNPLTIEQLAQHPLLVREKGSTARAVLENAMAKNELSPHILWESASSDALVRAAARGLGVAILPEELAQTSIDDRLICLRTIEGSSMKRGRVVAWHQDKYLTDSMQHFLALCRNKALEQKAAQPTANS